MKKQVIAAAVFMGASIPSFASNFYVLADAGQSKMEADVEGFTFNKTDNAISIGGGYKFNDNFALELAYRDLGEIKGEESGYVGGGDYIEAKISNGITAFQISLVGSIALGEAASLYGRVGMANLEADLKSSYEASINGSDFSGSESESVSKNKAVFGAGLSYSFTPTFALRAEYSQYAEWENLTVSSTTIGLTYQF
ncbi:outer membrane beta-barrel protein [Cellvibrio sp. NN19]|uniref:outer membrane beta-barrel protein n=1 Tax=Cellvibrio chitinivorans TaxID=3102792 RepID=UPI002B410052|nr:outer membrane beta-barrel protein [Cellvibrio sp. NN19]